MSTANAIPNLWGTFENVPPVRTPASIVREQAALLKDLTGGLLEGQVESFSSRSLEIYVANHSLYAFRLIGGMVLRVVAPDLNNYGVELLTILYPSDFYPAIVNIGDQRGGLRECEDEKSVLEALKECFEHGSTKRLIGGLLTESKLAAAG